MKYFINDTVNKRFVLVDEIFPTLSDKGNWSEGNTTAPTRNSNQQRLYHTLYVWENVLFREAAAENGVDHVLSIANDGGWEDGSLIIIPSNDCYIINKGAYLYNNQTK